MKASDSFPCLPIANASETAAAGPAPQVTNGEAKPLAAAFSLADTWVFDLDNTLYPADCGLWPKIDQRITLYLAEIFGLDGMSSRALQKYYYERYGTTLRGLMEEHGLDPRGFLDFTHDIDRSFLLPNPLLAGAITALPGRKLILTNGSRDHALATAGALGLEEMFEDIFDIEDAGFLPKPAAAAYERFFDRHEIEPSRSVMFDDLARNLIIPSERGMTTVLVVPKPGQEDHREAFETAREEAAAYINYVTSDLARFLMGLVPARSHSNGG
ncbi:MAG: pyrimidine 5'-nucleotidase [Beijerinckiaceae bacterium]|nr:pyrimidine 5'-nucleotidase [Beijerinckiaceae bacterium]